MSVRLAGLVIAVLLVGASPAAAAPDRKPPSKPGDFRVTAKSQTTVTVAWNASTDNSGSVAYDVRTWRDGRYVTLATLGPAQTTYTAAGLIPNVTYFFHVEAVDPSGNRTFSDGASATTDRDRTPPGVPGGLQITRVTASQIDLDWDVASDDTGIRAYQVTGTPSDWNLIFTSATSATVVGLAPATTYTFTVRAQDLGYNFSPASVAVAATTTASTDVTAPSPPTSLFVDDQSCGEVGLRWTQSTDDQDPQAAIRYRIFINGVLDPGGIPIGVGRWITYGVDGVNEFVLRAVDSAGNVSAPSNVFRITLDDCM
jgi:chitinase